jgi:hypothetical protein
MKIEYLKTLYFENAAYSIRNIRNYREMYGFENRDRTIKDLQVVTQVGL